MRILLCDGFYSLYHRILASSGRTESNIISFISEIGSQIQIFFCKAVTLPEFVLHQTRILLSVFLLKTSACKTLPSAIACVLP